MWKLILCILPCAVALRTRGVDCDNGCRVSDVHEEYLLHIFFHCKVATLVWLDICPDILHYVQEHGALLNLGEVMAYAEDNGSLVLFCYILWIVWKNKNTACF